VGVGGGGVGVGVAVGVSVCTGVGVCSGVGRAVLVGSDRMETPADPSLGLSPAEQAAKKTVAVSAAIAPARRIAISRRFYRKGGRDASLL